MVSEPFQDNSKIWEDEDFPSRLKVKSIVELTPETAVPVLELRNKLSFFENLTSPHAWTGRFRGSPTKRNSSDGKAVTESPISYSEMLADLDAGVSENQLAGEYYIGSNKPDRGAGSFYTQHFRGKIDEIQIYKRALTPEEICRLYRSVSAD